MLEAQGKDKIFWQILNAALELDCKKGHLKWTLTDLSRKSQVTRSLIYYYFGRSKSTLLDEAIKFIGSEFIGLNKERVTLWEAGRFKESMLKTRELVDKMPYLCNFILDHRSQKSEIGLSVLKMEKKFVNKLRKFYSHLDNDSVDAIFTLYWGMCFAPEISQRALVKCVNLIQMIK